MQVSVESVNNIERRITVGVPAERIETEVQKRLQEASQNVRIDGFRPGKVPMRVIKQRYGAGVRQEVVGEVIRETYMEALTQEKLTPAGPPSIEPKELEEGKDLEFVATIEIFPEITIADMSALEIETVTATVVPDDVNAMVERLRNQQSTSVEVDRKSKLEDEVIIDFVGTKDGEEFEGGVAQDQPLVLGSNSMIPGFEEGIVGLKKGEEKVLELTFPEEYQAEDLAGKDVAFTVKVKSVNEKAPAELNDEFFVKFGVTEGGEEKFREDITKNMERELKGAIKNKVKARVMNALLSAHDIELPKSLVDQEIDRLRQEMVQQIGGDQGGFDPATLPAELFTGEAEKRVSSGLIVNRYIDVNKIQQDETRLRTLIEEMASTYEDPKEVIDYIYTDEKQLSQFSNMAMEDQVIDAILAELKTTEVAASYEDAIKPDAPEVEETAKDEEQSEA